MVSVVIPAYNEEKTIGFCLRSLTGQRTRKQFEVILVDNGSTDDTRAEALRFSRRLRLKLISESIKSRGAARKAGFAHAKGDIILSTDADTVVPPDWIERMTSMFTDDSVAATTGTCCIKDCDSVTNAVFNTGQPIGMGLYRLVFGHYWLSGFSFAIRTSVYRQSGGFDALLNAEEDIDLSFRVSRLGRVHFISSAVVTVSGRRFKRGIVLGILPYCKAFFAYLSRRHHRVVLSDPR